MLALWMGLVASCASWTTSETVYVQDIRTLGDASRLAQLVVPDGTVKALNGAARSAAATKRELGGCARLVRRSGMKFYVDEPYVSYIEQSRDGVTVVCKPKEVIWHTHVDPEQDPKERCQPSEMDVQEGIKYSALGIIVCGQGVDNFLLYGWENKGGGRR